VAAVPGINGVRWKNFTPGTPSRLLGWIAVPVLGVLACGLLLVASIGALRGDLGVVGVAEEPAAVSASRLAFDLQAMDGHVADLLLIGDATGLSETRSDAYQKFESAQADANAQLELIGSGIDTIQDGPAAYLAIENQLSQYTQYVAYAMYIDDQLHGQHAGEPPAAATQAYEHASSLMNQGSTGILAQADLLEAAEQGSEFLPVTADLGTIDRLRWECGLLIAFTVISLLIVQRKLSRAFRRTVNPLLALATVVVLIFGVLLFSALGAAKSAFDGQDLSGPNSVATLWQARAMAAQMHASMSRWLIEGGDPGEQQIFTSGQKWITSVPELPEKAVGELNSYLATDQTLQGLVQGGGTYESFKSVQVAYVVGNSETAYAAFDADLAQEVGVDQQAFAVSTARGENGLVTWLWLPWLWMVAAIALIFLGFAPRLREYR
jgi:hypothetical protein